MYKKITHNIVEEHFDHPSVVPQLKSPVVRSEPDVIKVDVPLMIRLLEWAREDSSHDIDLHIVTENLISCGDDVAYLTMDNYPAIVSQNNPEAIKKK